MGTLILNELYVCINKKTIYFWLLIQFVILCPIYFVYSSSSSEGIEATTLEAALNVFGGLSKKHTILSLAFWLSIIVMLMIISYNITNVLYGFDVMLITRCGSKTKWWLSKVIAIIIINVIYSLVVIVSTKAISIIFLKNVDQLSPYSQIYYEHIYESSISPVYLKICVIAILITGFMAINTLFQNFNIIFFNSSKAYVCALIVSIFLLALYSKGAIPRWMSPLNYPSILDLDGDKDIYLHSIIFNLVLTLFNIIIGLIIINRKDYKSLHN